MLPWPLSELVERFNSLTDRPVLSTAFLALNFIWAIPSARVAFWQVAALQAMTVLAIAGIWAFRFYREREQEILDKSFFRGDRYLSRIDVPESLVYARFFSGMFIIVFIFWSLYWDAVSIAGAFSAR